MILIIVKSRIRPEYADDFPALVAEFTAATRAEPGNLRFDWSRDVENPNVYVLVEAFADGAAGATHVASEHFATAMARLGQLVADVPEIVNVEIEGGWSRMAELQIDQSDS